MLSYVIFCYSICLFFVLIMVYVLYSYNNKIMKTRSKPLGIIFVLLFAISLGMYECNANKIRKKQQYQAVIEDANAHLAELRKRQNVGSTPPLSSVHLMGANHPQ